MGIQLKRGVPMTPDLLNPRKAYPSDVTDAQWKILEPLVPKAKPGGGPAKYPRREILNALFYVARTGCAWRQLPHDLPPWILVYIYFRVWKLEGTLDRIHDRLRGDLREAMGRQRQPSAGIIDSHSVKTTEKGGSMDMTPARK